MREQAFASVSALLSNPAASPSLRDWTIDLEQALLRELRMDLAGVVLGMPGGDEARSASFTQLTTFMSRHYATNAGDQRRRRLRLTSWVRRMLWPDPAALKRSDYFAECLVPMRYFDAGGCAATSEGRESVLYVGRHRELSMGEDDLSVLQRLQPAFAAGIALLTALDTVLEDLGRALGRAGAAAAVLREDGSVAHVTPALAEELSLAGADLHAAIRETGRQRWARSAAAPTETKVCCVVEDRLSLRYTLRTSFIPARPGWPIDAVVVLVEPLPDPQRRLLNARRRFDLTDRETEVLHHLLSGLTDRQIADRLGISWHTARRHAERVLGKLECERRGQLSQKLSGPLS